MNKAVEETMKKCAHGSGTGMAKSLKTGME